MIAAAAVAITGLVGSAPQAEAGLEISIGFGQIYVSSYADCGCPIYTRRDCRGFDRYHRPVFEYHRQPFRCGGHHQRSNRGRAYGHDKHYKQGKSKYDKHFYKAKKPKKKCK